MNNTIFDINEGKAIPIRSAHNPLLKNILKNKAEKKHKWRATEDASHASSKQ